jgi:hypothetical protein
MSDAPEQLFLAVCGADDVGPLWETVSEHGAEPGDPCYLRLDLHTAALAAANARIAALEAGLATYQTAFEEAVQTYYNVWDGDGFDSMPEIQTEVNKARELLNLDPSKPDPRDIRIKALEDGLERIRRGDFMICGTVDKIRNFARALLDGGKPWNGPGEKPHQYNPDPMMMGDCRVCGHTWQAHQK